MSTKEWVENRKSRLISDLNDIDSSISQYKVEIERLLNLKQQTIGAVAILAEQLSVGDVSESLSKENEKPDNELAVVMNDPPAESE
jgi:hypothetical protein